MSQFDSTNKMESEQNDFVVETKGHCFLCLKRKLSLQRLASELAFDPSASPLNSLQCLSRYIQLDMRKVFCSDDLESIPPHLLEKVQKSNLKVELCEECASINQRFSGLHRQLEKIEMEMASCLELILSKLGKTKKSGDTFKFENLTELHTLALDKGKLEVVEALRKDVFEKSAHKIGRSRNSLRIKIKRLTRKEVIASSKPKCKPSPTKANMDMDEEGYQLPSNVKFEDANEEFVMDDDNGDFPDQSEDANSEENYSGNVEVEMDNITTGANSASLGFPSTLQKNDYKSVSINNPNNGKIKCQLCSKEFNGRTGFNYHYKSVHLQAKYKCSVCDKEFVHKPSFNRHYQSAHTAIKFSCQFCDKEFKLKTKLNKHLKQCHSKTKEVEPSNKFPGNGE